jgi:hypothetical protein
MKYFIFFALTYGCSQVQLKKLKSEEKLVHLENTFDQLRSSYLKGCVDAFHHLKAPVSFAHCRDQAIDHEKEIREIVESEK